MRKDRLCLAYHLRGGEFPACCFSQEAEATYDRSFARLVKDKGAINVPSPYPRVYARLGHITPIPADCGQLCGKRCCKGGEDDGMILFPGEDHFPVSFHITGRMINGHPVKFAVCPGRCRRETRPLSCRIYPLVPYLDKAGTLSVIPDPRAKYVCPLLSESALPLLDQRFRKAVLDVFKLLLNVDGMRSMLTAYSRMMDAYRRFVG